MFVGVGWHLDFHQGSLRVLIDNKCRWVYPLLLGIIDDHSRLCCHAQWYLAEGAEELDIGKNPTKAIFTGLGLGFVLRRIFRK